MKGRITVCEHRSEIDPLCLWSRYQYIVHSRVSEDICPKIVAIAPSALLVEVSCERRIVRVFD